MKTEHKYITYRQDRDCYQVSIKVNSKQITKTCKTLEEALEKRSALLALHKLDPSALAEMGQKKPVDAVPALEEAFPAFVEKEIRPRVAISTYSKYTLCGRQYSRHLGKLKIDEIKREVWQKVFSSVQSQRKLSYSYVVDDYRRFKAMYEYYVSLGVVKDNPLEKKIKLLMTHKTKRRSFTDKEKERFLTSALEYHYEWHFIFSLYFQTGCRRGELLAIQWQDLDYVNKRLYIRRNISRGTIDGKFTELVGVTKTESSIRSIPLSAENVRKFKLLYNSKKEKPSLEDFVFQPIFNKVKYDWISLGSIERAFTLIRDKAKLDKTLTIHCIRHTVASKLMTSGVDIATIQAIGGWSSSKTLLSVYAHTNEQAKEKAIQALCD